MTDDLDKRSQWVQSEATGGAGEGEPALSVAAIRAEIDAEFAEMGEVVLEANLPTDASIRANGFFDDPLALEEYLVNGGLLAYDGDGNRVKLGLVYIVETVDIVDESTYYQVYIRDSSEGL